MEKIIKFEDQAKATEDQDHEDNEVHNDHEDPEVLHAKLGHLVVEPAWLATVHEAQHATDDQEIKAILASARGGSS